MDPVLKNALFGIISSRSKLLNDVDSLDISMINQDKIISYLCYVRPKLFKEFLDWCDKNLKIS